MRWLLCHLLDWHRLDLRLPVRFDNGWFVGQCRRCRDIITYKSSTWSAFWSAHP